MQKKTVSLRTKQHIYESYITIHYQIILFFIKNINDYLNDGWLMKDVKRSAFKSSQTPWKLWKTVKTGVQASITVHLEEPIENSTEVFINYVIGLQVINFNILYQPLKFEHFTAILSQHPHSVLALLCYSVRGVCVHRKPEMAFCEPRFWIRKEWWHTRQI